MINLVKLLKGKYWGYFILAARLLLGWTFLRYGYAKLTDGQFGLTSEELSKPLSELSIFRLSWYLFDFQPFKYFIGIAQLICGSLLIYNRTAILGAFLFLPIVTVILIIDLSFMPATMASNFAWRLSYYIVLDLLILWYYKERLAIIWKACWEGVDPKFKYPLWAYLILPLLAIILEIMSPKIIFNLVSNPRKIVQAIGDLLQ